MNIPKITLVFYFFLVATGGLFPMAVDATNISRGAVLSFSCAACHGTDGKSPGAIPSIAGKSAEFIETSLKDFRSGKRASTVMGRHAKGYSDEEIKHIANFFARQ